MSARAAGPDPTIARGERSHHAARQCRRGRDRGIAVILRDSFVLSRVRRRDRTTIAETALARDSTGTDFLGRNLPRPRGVPRITVSQRTPGMCHKKINRGVYRGNLLRLTWILGAEVQPAVGLTARDASGRPRRPTIRNETEKTAMRSLGKAGITAWAVLTLASPRVSRFGTCPVRGLRRGGCSGGGGGGGGSGAAWAAQGAAGGLLGRRTCCHSAGRHARGAGVFNTNNDNNPNPATTTARTGHGSGLRHRGYLQQRPARTAAITTTRPARTARPTRASPTPVSLTWPPTAGGTTRTAAPTSPPRDRPCRDGPVAARTAPATAAPRRRRRPLRP